MVGQTAATLLRVTLKVPLGATLKVPSLTRLLQDPRISRFAQVQRGKSASGK